MSATTFRAIITGCFPELRIRSCEYLSQGWDSVAVVVNDALIFRFPLRPVAEPQYLMEARLLGALTDRVSLPIPRFAYIWEGRAPHEHVFVGYPMLVGVQLRRGMLPALDEARLAARLGGFLAELHSFPVERAVSVGLAHEDAASWRTGGREQYAKIRARVFPLLDAAEREHVAARWEAFLGHDANFRFEPAVLHADLTGDHILVDTETGEITGIIDWGDAIVGDPAYDFAGLLADYGPEFARLALASYGWPIDPRFMDRVAFYMAAMPFNEILYGQDTGSAQHVELGLRMLRDEPRTTSNER
jgi:aminoglycoside 2''-phosphotransferase